MAFYQMGANFIATFHLCTLACVAFFCSLISFDTSFCLIHRKLGWEMCVAEFNLRRRMEVSIDIVAFSNLLTYLLKLIPKSDTTTVTDRTKHSDSMIH